MNLSGLYLKRKFKLKLITPYLKRLRKKNRRIKNKKLKLFNKKNIGKYLFLKKKLKLKLNFRLKKASLSNTKFLIIKRANVFKLHSIAIIKKKKNLNIKKIKKKKIKFNIKSLIRNKNNNKKKLANKNFSKRIIANTKQRYKKNGLKNKQTLGF